jgi:hypothetical protein
LICTGLPTEGGDAAPARKALKVDAAKVIALMGNPTPFLLEAGDPEHILIYSTRPVTLKNKDLNILKARLRSLIVSLKELTLVAATPFTAEFFVPHKVSIEAISALNADFKVTAFGNGRVHVAATKAPNCDVWAQFVLDVRRLAWQTNTEPSVDRLFYLTAADANTAVGGSATTSSSGAAPASAAAQPASPAAAAPAAGSSNPAGGAAPASPPASNQQTQATPASTSVAANSAAKVTPVNLDTLVFTTPADSGSALEKRQILALLDLPRPEVIVNAFVAQGSSHDAQAIARFEGHLQEMVAQFNDGLEQMIQLGWQSIRDQKVAGNFFDPQFERYLTYRYVGELPYRQPTEEDSAKIRNRAVQQILDLRWDSCTTAREARDKEQVCDVGEYCLGYTTLFSPIKPRLTDLLIAVIGAIDPKVATTTAINNIEGRNPADPQPSDGTGDCRGRDLEKLRATDPGTRPRFFMQCFFEKASVLWVAQTTNPKSETTLGLARSAIADFLFNYKMSQQYPHDFSPYELSRSADTLNAVLAPFIEGFNEDLKTYQNFLHTRFDCYINQQAESRGWFPWSNKDSFINNGIVSVRTISGVPTTVSATSQSFLDTSTAPQLADLAAAITGENPTTGSDKRPTGILGNLTLNQAQFVLGALKSYQSSSAQIGRLLSLDFTPRSLAAASSAEIDVTLKAEDSAAPTYYSGSNATKAADISRVATHDTKTKIRVDSLKLFAVSAFSGELRKSRSRFPLLPLPAVEVPYIGSVVGVPLKPAKEYHTSTAIISAIVVPTAADLAYGLAFVSDRFRVKEYGTPAEPAVWQMRRAVSLSDFREQPILNFHRKKLECFAFRGDPASVSECKDLQFNSLPRDLDDRK